MERVTEGKRNEEKWKLGHAFITDRKTEEQTDTGIYTVALLFKILDILGIQNFRLELHVQP